MAVDLINFKNLQLLPEQKNNKLFIDDNNFLNINNNLKIKNLNIIEKNNLIKFSTYNDIQIDTNLIYKDLYTHNNDSLLFKNISNINENYCLNLINKINIKSVENFNNNQEKIEILTDNFNEILPNSIKYIIGYSPINKEYLFKTIENNIYIENLEDGEYKIIDRKNNIFELEFLNQKTIKPLNIDLKNKIFINGKKINNYKVINNNDLLPIIIKSIQDLYKEYADNINNINNSINDVNKIPNIENKLEDALVNTQIINNLNMTYQKIINDNNKLQSKYLKCEEILKENNLLKNKIHNLEIQMTNLANKI